MMAFYRLQNGLTQREAAKLAGISTREWSCLERQRLDYCSLSSFNEIITNVALLIEVDERAVDPDYDRPIALTDLSFDELSEVEPATQDKVADPFLAVMDRELIDQVPFLLLELTYREREIIKLRFGIGGGNTYTLEEVGKIFKVTRERVRKVEAKAIRKLQHPARASRLEGFLSPWRQEIKPRHAPCGWPA